MRVLVGLALALSMVACGPTTTANRAGMVVDPDTGLMYGSRISNRLFIDAGQFANRKIKVDIRNVSGDTAFDMRDMQAQLENALAARGYDPVRDDSFGIKFDLLVRYSGQVSRSRAAEFGLLGAAAGGVGGVAAAGDDTRNAAIGAVSGATLGTIIGSYNTVDTYIMVADMRVSVRKLDDDEGAQRSITFSRSSRRIDDKKKTKPFESYYNSWSTDVAVYAGGNNTPQAMIADEVRARMIRIAGDFL